MKRFLIVFAILAFPLGVFAADGALFKSGVRLIYSDGKYFQNNERIAAETAEIMLQYYNKASALNMESGRGLRASAGTLLVVGNTMLMFGVTSTICGVLLDTLEATIAGAGISGAAALVDLVALVLAMSSEGKISRAVDDYNGSLDKSFNIKIMAGKDQACGLMVGTSF
jgi:hypothetical protein